MVGGKKREPERGDKSQCVVVVYTCRHSDTLNRTTTASGLRSDWTVAQRKAVTAAKAAITRALEEDLAGGFDDEDGNAPQSPPRADVAQVFTRKRDAKRRNEVCLYVACPRVLPSLIDSYTCQAVFSVEEAQVIAAVPGRSIPAVLPYQKPVPRSNIPKPTPSQAGVTKVEPVASNIPTANTQGNVVRRLSPSNVRITDLPAHVGQDAWKDQFIPTLFLALTASGNPFSDFRAGTTAVLDLVQNIHDLVFPGQSYDVKTRGHRDPLVLLVRTCPAPLYCGFLTF